MGWPTTLIQESVFDLGTFVVNWLRDISAHGFYVEKVSVSREPETKGHCE